MFLVAVTVATLVALPAADKGPSRQARATVRIVRAEPLHFAELEREQPNELRVSLIRSRDGTREPIRLYEYQ